MPRASRQSAQSNDLDFVQQPRYSPRKTPLPPEYEKYKGYRAIDGYQPLIYKEIETAGPNLPQDLDIDDPLAFFQLFFTDELFQHLQECTNAEAQKRSAGMQWRPRSIKDLKTYIGKNSK
jgi:hypothetical protein